ncbi:hypothetical protein [Citrobacter sp. Igbk 14]|uniref:hypothetical protein n=1 Tax=Citrobacter sp. Igbk 14 TaxID=2963960 RepID=UPI002302F0A6|nr:hypothetical protein [Citrobacter sp. Igbk 14]MDA8511366.1 hypothetical protein [Citrobacter sp. Igbk 14]
MTVHDAMFKITRLIGQLHLRLKHYISVSLAFIGENVTQTRHTNGSSIPNILKRGNRYCLHFRLPSGGFFYMSLGCDSASVATVFTPSPTPPGRSIAHIAKPLMLHKVNQKSGNIHSENYLKHSFTLSENNFLRVDVICTMRAVCELMHCK